ncbi:MAG: hypothetical protein O0V67_00240 [Methanocorpusculum sp.]|nr:hypothetical protein [Methanocorpusculum sp.]
MELTREDYAEAFGLSDEERAAWEAQDNADGDQETQEGPETGADTRDGPEGRQEPQEGPEGGQGTGDTEEGGGAQGGAEQRREMPPEERHRQAEARRARERAGMERAAQEAAQARVDEAYRTMFAGQTNPYTGQPIRSEADYRAWQAEKQRRDSEEQLRAAGIDPAAIQGAVDRQVQPLRQELEMARMETMRERARRAQDAAQVTIRQQLDLIARLDPSVKSMEDIAAMPTAEAFRGYVAKGLGLEEAFYMANRKAIEERKLTAARAAGVSAAASKGHLAPVGGGGQAETVEVPAEQRALYRELMPEATDAEILAAYKQYLKGMK